MKQREEINANMGGGGVHSFLDRKIDLDLYFLTLFPISAFHYR